MDRWDFDCQECGRNIGDAWYVDPVWYMCSQDMNEHKLLERVYPRTLYSIAGEDIILDDKNIPEDIAKMIKERIKDYIKRKSTIKSEMFSRDLETIFYPGTSEVIWHLPEKEDEYYQKAGIKKHEIKGRGRDRLGYTFDEECAKKLGYKCNLCGSELVRVTADQHPGGQWGIRGSLGIPVREPAPMKHASIRLRIGSEK